MKTQAKGLIFDAFNARFSSPEKVAETFIAPEHFWKLCEPSHSLIVGPRGSGKTSLLKMLQTPALRAWKHQQSQTTLDSLGFVGVFIPTDVLWDEQTQRLGEDFLEVGHREALIQSAISLQVLRSLVTAVLDEFIPASIHSEAGPRGTLRVKREQDAVDYLADVWRVKCDTPSFKGLRRALTRRLTDLGFFVAQERFLDSTHRDSRFAESGLIYPSFLDLVRPALECLDEALENSKLKWALCFDELELAPTALQAELLRLLRSTEQRIFFKLSISPYARSSTELSESPIKPEEGDDFSLIPLWYAEKRQSEEFSRELAEAFLAELGHPAASPQKVFGVTAPTDSLGGSGYSKGSPNYLEILELKKKDTGFSAYLEAMGIKIEEIDRLSEVDRASQIRKIMPIIMHRNFFRRFPQFSGKQQSRRSRKSFALYTGWQAIAAISEGNPRVLKGLITNMIRRVESGTSRVPSAIQWDEIEGACHRFRSKLKTIPITTGGRDRGVLKLLDIVGRYFERELLGAQFIVEPVSSFTLDVVSAEQYEDAVGSALNSGALVFLPGDKGKMILGNLKEKRFRLSYLMATHFCIPLRIGPHVTLATIFSNSGNQEQQLLLPDND